jgi:hypothetical protein
MSYPQQPENWSDPTAQPAQPAQPGPPAQPAYDPSAYPGGDPASAYPGYPGYPAGPQGAYPAYGYPMMPARPTNGLAIASMVVSILAAVGLCMYGLGGWIGIVGAILGHVARRQTRERGDAGEGMALAGIIVGWIAAGIALIATGIIVAAIIWAANQPTT